MSFAPEEEKKGPQKVENKANFKVKEEEILKKYGIKKVAPSMKGSKMRHETSRLTEKTLNASVYSVQSNFTDREKVPLKARKNQPLSQKKESNNNEVQN
mmetsp:Transcript_94/g.72  ORF Transcript_94/g.72 Transcript_94/m.72 type:complete len:99 (-) Transcript_94:119-415(-)